MFRPMQYSTFYVSFLRKPAEVYNSFFSRYLKPSNADAILPIISDKVVVSV